MNGTGHQPTATSTLARFKEPSLINGKGGNRVIDAFNAAIPAGHHGQEFDESTPRPMALLQITSLKRLGIYGVKVLEDNVDPTQSGPLVAANLGNVPASENAELWDMASLQMGINNIAIGATVEARYVSTRTGTDEGTNIFIRDAGSLMVPIIIGGANRDYGNYRWEYTGTLATKDMPKWDAWYNRPGYSGSIDKIYNTWEIYNGDGTGNPALSGYKIEGSITGIMPLVAGGGTSVSGSDEGTAGVYRISWAVPVTLLDGDGNSITEYWVTERNDPIIECSSSSGSSDSGDGGTP